MCQDVIKALTVTVKNTEPARPKGHRSAPTPIARANEKKYIDLPYWYALQLEAYIAAGGHEQAYAAALDAGWSDVKLFLQEAMHGNLGARLKRQGQYVLHAVGAVIERDGQWRQVEKKKHGHQSKPYVAVLTQTGVEALPPGEAEACDKDEGVGTPL